MIIPLCLAVFGAAAWAAPDGADPGAAEEQAPMHVAGAVTVSVDEAHRLFREGVRFVDVRNPRLFARRHIPGAIHLDLRTDFDKAALEALVGKDDPVVIYCSGVKCRRSSTAADFAVQWGFAGVRYFRGGIVAWRDAGLPLSEAE